MSLYRQSKINFTLNRLSHAFLILGFLPFLFPNPIITTNIQPYAAMVGSLVFLLGFGNLSQNFHWHNASIILGGTFLVSIIVMFFSGVTIDSIRGVYNYYALFIIPCATIIALNSLKDYPEKTIKIMIIIWFSVASIQFFVYRGFATQLISGVRWSYRYRGVVGLASEPSFLGIACFYFLHIVRRFKTHKVVFSALVLVMGILYAQSTTGILFLAGYYVVFLFDMTNTKKGMYIWMASIVAFIGFVIYLNTKLVNSRLYQMIDSFWNGGVDSVLSDGSANVRFNAIERALSTARDNLFFPSGFSSRIGSAYGGLLVELGIFAIPAILLISYNLALTFNKKSTKRLYFIVVTLLLLNNTQIGNPLLLIIIGTNIYYRRFEVQEGTERIVRDDKTYQSA